MKRLTSVPLRAFPLPPRAPPCSRNTMQATQEISNCLEATLNKEKEAKLILMICLIQPNRSKMVSFQ